MAYLSIIAHMQNESTKMVNQTNQLSSISKVLTTLAAALIVILGLQYIAKDLIAPLLMAFFLAILIRPLFNFYRKRGIGSGGSIALVLVTIVIIFAGLVLLLTRSISILQDSLATYTEGIRQTVASVSGNLNIDEETTEAVTQSISPDTVTKLVSTLVGSLGSLALYLIVVPILALLIVLQLDSVPKKVAEQMVKENPKLGNLSKFADSMMIYVVGRFKVNLITGLLFAIALLILNVDFPFFWGVMTVFLSFIPYLGIVLAATPPTLIALAEQGPFAALMVIGSVVVINLLAENVLDPIVQGKGNKLSPAAVIVSVIFWGWILGAVGMILAAPLTVLLKLIFSEYKETAWLGQVIEGDFSELPTKSAVSTSKFAKLKKNLASYFKNNK